MKKTIYFLAIPLLLSCGVKSEETGTNVENETTMQTSDQVCERIDKVKFKLAIANEEMQLLDVRTPEEFAEGHIEGAINIDFLNANFSEQIIAQLKKEIPVYLYCRSGGRSAKAMLVLRDLGFQTVYELEGGFMGFN